MNKQYEKIVQSLKRSYLNSNFEIKEDHGSIKLLCDNKELAESEEYLDIVCELALEYLNPSQQNVFCTLYDFFDEMTVVADMMCSNQDKNNYDYNLYAYSQLDVFDAKWNTEDIAA